MFGLFARLFRGRPQHRPAYHEEPPPWRGLEPLEPEHGPRRFAPPPAPEPVVLEPTPSIPAIARLIKTVTYGELMEMAEGMAAVCGGITPEQLARWLHQWSNSLPELAKG